jgi:hypothetical protein
MHYIVYIITKITLPTGIRENFTIERACLLFNNVDTFQVKNISEKLFSGH